MTEIQDEITSDQSGPLKKRWQHELFDHLAASKLRNSNGNLPPREYRKKLQAAALSEADKPIYLSKHQPTQVFHRDSPCGKCDQSTKHRRHDSLIVGDIKNSVQLPPNTELADWLALNAIDFYNQINLIFSVLGDKCSAERGQGHKFVKDNMDWIRSRFEDQTLFPMDDGVPFAADFKESVEVIARRMLQMFAHFFDAHIEFIDEIGIGNHAQTMFEHFYYFVSTFNLVDKADLQAKAFQERLQHIYTQSM